MSESLHSPVMVREVISFLRPENKKLYFDGTFGQGGYAKEILDKANSFNFLLIETEKKYADNLKKYKSRFTFKIDKLRSQFDIKKRKNKSIRWHCTGSWGFKYAIK